MHTNDDLHFCNRVSVSLQRRGSAIQIVVEDDGAGLTDGVRAILTAPLESGD